MPCQRIPRRVGQFWPGHGVDSERRQVFLHTPPVPRAWRPLWLALVRVRVRLCVSGAHEFPQVSEDLRHAVVFPPVVLWQVLVQQFYFPIVQVQQFSRAAAGCVA